MSDVHEVGKRGGRAGRIGTILREKWRVDARLGTGGMAAVYAATHYRNGNRVALKILHQELSRDPETRTRFLREGYVANAVNHPGVVRVLDDDVTEDGCAFLVLELLEGESAETRRERMGGRLPLQEVLHIGDRLLDVLAAAHEQKIVHRDVKPENIFLTNDGNVKLLDFGIARMRDAGGEATKTGVMLGTPDFMSPEQAGGRSDLDGRTDVYLTGATLFMLLSGQRVHMGETIRDQLFAITTMRARSLTTAAPNVPLPIVHVIDKALELEKEDRWVSARAMQEALRRAAIQTHEMESDPNSVTITVAQPIDLSSPISTPPTPLMNPSPGMIAASKASDTPRTEQGPNSDGPTLFDLQPAHLDPSGTRRASPAVGGAGPPRPATPGPQPAPRVSEATPPSRPSGTRQPGPGASSAHGLPTQPLSPQMLPLGPGGTQRQIPSPVQHGMTQPLPPGPRPPNAGGGRPFGWQPYEESTGRAAALRTVSTKKPSVAGRVVLFVLLLVIAVAIAVAVFLAQGGKLKLSGPDAPSATLSAHPRGSAPAPASSSKP
jgi:serine/threonine-protein kinase